MCTSLPVFEGVFLCISMLEVQSKFLTNIVTYLTKRFRWLKCWMFSISIYIISIFILNINKVLNVSIWKSPPVADCPLGLRWLPLPRLALAFTFQCVCDLCPSPWPLADLTGSHDDNSLLPIDQGWWWELPLVSMLTIKWSESSQTPYSSGNWSSGYWQNDWYVLLSTISVWFECGPS